MVKILLAAGEADFCNSLEGFLCRQGYQVIASTSGKEAIEKARNEKPQLIILDIQMPDMDGLDILKRIRQLDEKIVITIVTAVRDPEVAQRAIKLGAVNYITKPLDLDFLKRSLEGWARQIEARQLCNIDILALEFEKEKLDGALSFLAKKGYRIKSIENRGSLGDIGRSDLVILRGDLLGEDTAGVLAEYKAGYPQVPVIVTLGSAPSDKLTGIFNQYGNYQYLHSAFDAYGFILAAYGMITRCQEKRVTKKERSLQESILIIDDESGICEYISVFLEKIGYRVSSLTNPRIAMDKIQSLDPTIVLLDIVMPDVSGLEILKGIKKTHPRICVIMMTGIKDDSVCRESLELGASDYLVKPFSLDQLKATILTNSIKSQLK